MSHETAHPLRLPGRVRRAGLRADEARRGPPLALLPTGAAALFLALSAVLLLGFGSPLRAQARRPLDPAHWAHELQETLHAMGVPGAELFLVQGVSGAAQLTAFRAALEGAGQGGVEPALRALLTTWLRRLESEVGPWDPHAGGRYLPGAESNEEDSVGLGSGLLLDGALGWARDPSLPVRSPKANGRVLVAGELGPGVSFWGEGHVTQGRGGKAIQSLGIGFSMGSFDAFVGRVPLAMGQGRDRFVLNGRKPAGGAFLTSRESFRLPGRLQGMGSFRLHVGFSPFISTSTTSSAWLGSYALSWSPHPRVDLGALRTTRFAGRGIEPFDVQSFFRMLVGRGLADSFDDSQGELAARVRWGILGHAVSTYLSVGFEDKTTVWLDPGLLLGVLIPELRPEALYSLRYEFLAFGSRVRWCWWCEEWTDDDWYLHPAYGPYFLEGEPLGALLGGYGASHRASAEAWLTALPLRGWLEYRREFRYADNVLLNPELFSDPAPERVGSWTLGAEALFRGGWGLSGALHTATLDGERELGLSLALRLLAGG